MTKFSEGSHIIECDDLNLYAPQDRDRKLTKWWSQSTYMFYDIEQVVICKVESVSAVDKTTKSSNENR